MNQNTGMRSSRFSLPSAPPQRSSAARLLLLSCSPCASAPSAANVATSLAPISSPGPSSAGGPKPYPLNPVLLSKMQIICNQHHPQASARSAPLRLCGTVPLLAFASASLRLIATAPLHHCASPPLRFSVPLPLNLTALPPLCLSATQPPRLSPSPPRSLTTSVPLRLSAPPPLRPSASPPLRLSTSTAS